MTTDPGEVVKVASGEMVQIEMYQSALEELGIESRVTGGSLNAGFGTVLPTTMELYVHASDLARAEQAINELEAERGTRRVEETGDPVE